MTRTLEFTPILLWKSALQGLAAGSLATAGIVSGFGPAIQAVLFVGGVLVFIDALIPNGSTSPVTTVVFTLIGIVASILTVLFGLILPWTVAVVVAIALFYFHSHSRKAQAERQGPQHA